MNDTDTNRIDFVENLKASGRLAGKRFVDNE